MRKPRRYEVIGTPVLDHVDRYAPDEVYDEFYDLLEALMEFGPYPDDQLELNILPHQEPTKPNAFSAPFDKGLLFYQVMVDLPIIKLVDVFWFGEDDEDLDGVGYAF